jgi:hypothetical protein
MAFGDAHHNGFPALSKAMHTEVGLSVVDSPNVIEVASNAGTMARSVQSVKTWISKIPGRTSNGGRHVGNAWSHTVGMLLEEIETGSKELKTQYDDFVLRLKEEKQERQESIPI